MFISFEGIDGAGKSTQISYLVEYFNKNNMDYIITREPGGCDFSEDIRKMILYKYENLDYLTELFLIFSARSEHYKKIIYPALLDKKIVISDRFIDSTIAYQGFARNLDLKLINKLNSFFKKPDLTFFLDIDPDLAFNRIKSFDRIELIGLDFQKKVREGYLYISKKEPNRFKIIDVNNLIEEEIFLKIKNLINNF